MVDLYVIPIVNWIAGQIVRYSEVLYLCIIFYNMHSFFSVCSFAQLLCVHIVFEQNFINPFFFNLSYPHCYSPSFHRNTSPKYLTPSFLKCTHDVIQVEQKSYASKRATTASHVPDTTWIAGNYQSPEKQTCSCCSDVWYSDPHCISFGWYIYFFKFQIISRMAPGYLPSFRRNAKPPTPPRASR